MADINDVYRQRNNLAIAFCKAALAAGWPAGRGVDDTKEPDDEWRHVVYVDLPSGDQVSWHMAPCAVHLLEGLPEYKGKWEGTFTARHKNWPELITVDPLWTLTKAERAFVDLVKSCPGSKLNGPGEAWDDDGNALWKKPEELGLVECVGSYKWVPVGDPKPRH